MCFVNNVFELIWTIKVRNHALAKIVLFSTFVLHVYFIWNNLGVLRPSIITRTTQHLHKYAHIHYTRVTDSYNTLTQIRTHTLYKTYRLVQHTYTNTHTYIIQELQTRTTHLHKYTHIHYTRVTEQANTCFMYLTKTPLYIERIRSQGNTTSIPKHKNKQ